MRKTQAGQFPWGFIPDILWNSSKRNHVKLLPNASTRFVCSAAAQIIQIENFYRWVFFVLFFPFSLFYLYWLVTCIHEGQRVFQSIDIDDGLSFRYIVIYSNLPSTVFLLLEVAAWRAAATTPLDTPLTFVLVTFGICFFHPRQLLQRLSGSEVQLHKESSSNRSESSKLNRSMSWKDREDEG